MNDQKIDSQEPSQNYGLIRDSSSGFANRSSQLIGLKQPRHITCFEPQTMGGRSQQQCVGPAKPSSTIMSRFESPASAFYATERCMGFPQYEGQVGKPSFSSQFSRAHDSQFPSYQASGEDFSSDLAHQDDSNFDIRNTLQAIVKSQFPGNQYYGSSERSYKISSSNSPGCKLLPAERNKLLGDSATYGGSQLLIPFKGNQDHMVCAS